MNCQFCGEPISSEGRKRQFCSRSCSAKSRWAPGGVFAEMEQAPSFKGNERFNAALNRWMINVPGRGSMYRYRFRMEEHLGRPLRSDEQVHHINGDSTDDRIENLELVSASDHGRLHSAEGTAALRSRLVDGWSFKHGQCVECGTSESKHVGHGLCSRCYYRDRRKAVAA